MCETNAMLTFTISPNSTTHLLHLFKPYHHKYNLPHLNPIKTLNLLHLTSPSPTTRRIVFAPKSTLDDSSVDIELTSIDDDEYEGEGDDCVEIEIEKLRTNSRRISARIVINADLESVWKLLTDYERLADFIPGLAVSQLLEKRPNFAKLLQIGQQNLAFGLKFNAKGIVECYEKDLEQLPYGRKRDIKFDMVEGDFQTFQGKWSIEQVEKTDTESSVEQIFQTTLSYIVDVKPKLWLPVRLVEGRLSSEIKSNLIAIRNEIQNTVINTTVDES